MDNTDLLSRRLSAPGCVIAGNQLAAHRKALSEDKLKLDKGVEKQADAVAAATQAIVALGTDDGRMVDVDRGADRFLGGFDGMLVEIERSFDNADLVPLTPSEEELRNTARSLHAKLFPNGTDFTRFPYRLQWERMNALHIELQKPETVAALKTLGLSPWASRLARWVALYGAKIGITAAKGDSDPVATAVDAWHVAWADFVVEVRATYRDATDANHVKARKLLLAPYQDQVAQERAEEVKAGQRAKRREKKDEQGGDA